MGGQVGDPAALAHEFSLYCTVQSLPDLGGISAPVFLYYGSEDPLTPAVPHAARWEDAYTNADVTLRYYPGEGHDVQYRHFDQILVDLSGRGDKIVACNREGKTKLVSESKAEKILEKGGSLGLCAWRD